MVNSKLLQNAYIQFYKKIREYILPFRVVELLADLEIAVYQAIPSIKDITRIFYQLRSSIRDISDEDEDLRYTLNQFAKQFENKEDAFIKLNKVNEVISK